ncbi:ABC transporter substrate-binding protein [Nesterenkonia xinjiangensis]|uniref:Peptide/nickel transport system substrate-binding protein n=1 Tax=Nesterenkonia xinjiangensis TaxID=225327 RepID=A0A7Z0GPC4_9MICC|nr:ABC transporter substrate-binding protein [Nesterenkonia xinjiangensis]NYJ78613.1 peptide/nickel transport system substrate-binding protein [Nesterenkonia xinjiangensis]
MTSTSTPTPRTTLFPLDDPAAEELAPRPPARRTTRRRMRAAGLGTAMLMALTACAGDAASGDGGDGGDSPSSITVNGADGTISENWNPFSPTALQPTLGVIYESLYWYNLADDVEPQHMLATGHSWNEEGTELTVTLREGVTWSDGEPFTADDVAYTFNRIQETPALNTSGLSASGETVDEHTVLLSFPDTSFMQEAAVLGNQAIVPEHIWSEVEDPVAYINQDPVGTGAFMLREFTDQSFVLEANPDYWSEDGPHLDEVRYVGLEDADAAAAALTAGEIDWMSTFLPGMEDLLATHEQLSWVNTPALTTSVFTCSSEELGCEGPQTDPAVRQAIYWAMDREQLNNLAGAGYGGTASPTLLLPDRDGDWISDDDMQEVPQAPEADQAAEILEEAGWEIGDDGIRVKDGERLSMTIQTVSGWSDYITINDTLAQQLAEVGIELRSTQVAWNEWNDNQIQGQFQLSLDSIGLGASSNPYFTYDPRYVSHNSAPVGEAALGQNIARYENEAVDEAVLAASQTEDPVEQAEQFAIVQEQIVEDMPYIPIYINSTLTQFNNTRATGWPSNEDPYAFAAAWKAWDNGIVLQTIEPSE